MSEQYEVLSPWAQTDPVTPMGITPRIGDLAGKTIGLFCDSKVAAYPIQMAVEKELKQRFPTVKFSYWRAEPGNRDHEIQSKDMPRFEKWASDVDTVITSVGD